MRRSRSSRAPLRRGGITLVEVMVALVLVAIGLLGIAGSSALLLRAAVAQAGERAAMRRLSLRVARIGAAGCDAARGDSAADPGSGTREWWRVTRLSPGAAAVDDTIEWRAPAGTRRLALRTALLC